MKSNILRSKVIPIIALILCFIIFELSLGPLSVIITAILVLFASFFEYKKEMFKSLGFQKNNLKAKSLFVYAPLIALVLFLVYYFVLVPVVTNITDKQIDFSSFKDLKGNITYAILALIFIWFSAAFGEEIIWRGYFMQQFSKFFGKGKLSIVLNILVFAILFGYMHSYQGITGQIVTGSIGAILSIIFYLRKSDLWFNVAIHGFFDTIALIVVYNGWF